MAKRSADTLVVVALLVGSVVGAGVTLSAVGPTPPGNDSRMSNGATGTGDDTTDPGETTGIPDPSAGLQNGSARVDTFDNESAFRSYVTAGNLLADGGHGPGPRVADGPVTVETDRSRAFRTETADAAGGGDGGGGDGGGGDGGGGGSGGGGSGSVPAPSRVANTNVQVASLDEPDIVKTDGRHFYYAPADRGHPRPVRTDSIREKDGRPSDPGTHVVDAGRPADPEAIATVNTTGKLLRTGDRLVVFEQNRVVGYDVSDPSSPSESWSSRLNGSLVTARERNGTLYVVTRTPVHTGTHCPIEPLGGDHPVACEDVYRPNTQIPVDATYSAFSVDATSGEVRDAVSFVGTARSSVVYVSPDALYVTYTKPTNRATLVGEFLREEFDRTPAHLEERIAEIQSYEITPGSKEREMRNAFERWVATLPEPERTSVLDSFERGLSGYVGDHQRTLTQTGVVRVDTVGDALTVEATGTVPGRPLNQFSMDQHNGTLRLATTVPGAGSADSENDLYVLDSDTLDRRGKVTGMGVTERVFAVRYVGDTAYVVTFRRVDPFHVVGLSDPANPEEVGQLELPGFSSYLHPVDGDHVLGVGEEHGKVKTVLFDVSDPANPAIADSTVLDRDWSAVSGSHHAFLMDRKHGVFVLPAGQRSVVMDYTDGSLSVETTIRTDDPATRTRYVDDFLYVFAGDSIAVVDETSWTRTGTLRLDESSDPRSTLSDWIHGR